MSRNENLFCIQVRNKKNQTPLDLCSDPTLLKLLQKCHLEHSSGGRDTPTNDKVRLLEYTERLLEYREITSVY